jgi:hypothetical protein
MEGVFPDKTRAQLWSVIQGGTGAVVIVFARPEKYEAWEALRPSFVRSLRLAAGRSPPPAGKAPTPPD